MANFNYQAVADTVASNRSNAQTAAAVGGVLKSFMDSWSERKKQAKLDDIANSILATQNAPRATAVSADDPDLEGTPQYNEAGGPVFQYNDGSYPGHPPTKAQEAADNAEQGFGWDTSKVPDLGGTDALKLSMAMDNLRSKQLLDQARAGHLLDLSGGGTATSLRPGAAERLQLDKDNLALRQSAESRRAAAVAARAGAAPKAVDPAKTYNDWFKLNTTVPVGSWSSLKNPAMTDGKGHGDTAGNFFEADVPTGNGGLRHIRLPKEGYNAAQQYYQNYLNSLKSVGASTAADALPSSPVSASPSGALFGGGSAAPTDAATQQAAAIRAQVKAGQLSREDAMTQLQALGFQ